MGKVFQAEKQLEPSWKSEGIVRYRNAKKLTRKKAKGGSQSLQFSYLLPKFLVKTNLSHLFNIIKLHEGHCTKYLPTIPQKYQVMKDRKDRTPHRLEDTKKIR